MTWTLDSIPPELADTVAQTLLRMGNSDGAYSISLALHRLLQERAKEDPENDALVLDLATLHDRLGDLELARGDTDNAHGHYSAALALRERLVAVDPKNGDWQFAVSMSLVNIGDLAANWDDANAADAAYGRARAIREDLTAAKPENFEWQEGLASVLSRLGDLYGERGIPLDFDMLNDPTVPYDPRSMAFQCHEQALAIRRRLAASNPANDLLRHNLEVSSTKLGALELSQGEMKTAHERFSNLVAARERRAASDPADVTLQRDLASSLVELGAVEQALGKKSAARNHFENALAIIKKLTELDPANVGRQLDLIIAHIRAAETAAAPKDHYEVAYEIAFNLRVTERFPRAKDWLFDELERRLWENG